MCNQQSSEDDQMTTVSAYSLPIHQFLLHMQTKGFVTSQPFRDIQGKEAFYERLVSRPDVVRYLGIDTEAVNLGFLSLSLDYTSSLLYKMFKISCLLSYYVFFSPSIQKRCIFTPALACFQSLFHDTLCVKLFKETLIPLDILQGK